MDAGRASFTVPGHKRRAHEVAATPRSEPAGYERMAA